LVSVKDVKMTDLETGNVLFDFSIYRISYCSADAIFSHVFAFITVNTDETMECHAFLCRKKKIAQAATMTIAQAFNLAFVSWKEVQEKEKDETIMNGKCISEKQTKSEESDCEECDLNEKFCNSEYGCVNTGCDEVCVKELNLLIDLDSPGDSLDDKFLVNIETDKSRDMDKEFSKLSTNVPILQHLPPNASSLSVGAFLGSQTLMDSPLESPLHGSSLTPGQLITPACSPCTHIRQMQKIDKKQTFPPSPLASPKLFK